MAIGRHAVRPEDVRHLIGRVVPETPWSATPDYHVDLSGPIRGDPGAFSEVPEDLVSRMRRRRRELYGDGPWHHRPPPPLQDIERPAWDHARGRPAPGFVDAISPEEPDMGGPYRSSLSRSDMERDVKEIVSVRRSDAQKAIDLAILRSLTRGPVHVGERDPRLRSAPQVLAFLNRKYDTNVLEPWRMLSYLRVAVDRLASSGADPDRWLSLREDHAWLRRVSRE